MPRVLNVGKENAEFQHLEVLKRNRAKRNEYNRIFVEGVACINALLEARWKVVTIAYDRTKSLSGWAQGVISGSKPEKILRLAPALMEKLSDREDPSEIIVIAERRIRRLDKLKTDRQALVVIFDRPSNHGNLGSLIRSCNALGATALITLGHSVDLFDPAVLRASLGAAFIVPVVHCRSPKEIESWIEAVRQSIPDFRVIGTTADADKSVERIDLTGPVAFVLGNEATGMSRKLTETVDECVGIPMSGIVDSLNVACAGTVLLYEASRQRQIQ